MMIKSPVSGCRLPNTELLGEGRPSYGRISIASGLTEADLSRIWEGQTFPPEAMATRDGTRLRVIYRGRRGHGPGPDFRDAIVAAPYGLLEGDVELHLRASDFRRHGHDADPAYDKVVLHLVLENDEAADTVLASGRRVPVVALGDWLKFRNAQIERWLERPARFREPCRDSLDRMGAGEVGRALDRLGDMRFRARAVALGKRLAAGEGADDLAWSGLLEALGYGGERERFRALAEVVPWGVVKRLAEGRRVADGRVLILRTLMAADSGGVAGAHGLIRPVNRFGRRLEGAAALASRLSSGIVATFVPLLSLEGRDGVREIVRVLEVPTAIGRSRAVEIAANVMLPLLSAVEGGRYERPAERIYALLPLPARYGAVRHLHEAVGSGVRQGARRQQGMLYLLKQYCTQGGCGRCPLS